MVRLVVDFKLIISKNMVINGHNYSAGDPVICILRGKPIPGRLEIRGSRLWICHNNSEFRGSEADHLWGMSYSWTFNYENERFTDEVTALIPSKGKLDIKESVSISNSLQIVTQMLPFQTGVLFFYCATKPYEKYDSFELSSKTGFIKMKGVVSTMLGKQNKSVEVKLSRFLKTVSDTIDNELFKLTDSQIEKAHNICVSFQQGSLFQLDFYEGEYIKLGYSSENYSNSNINSLQKSCMTNKFDFLELYTMNKEVVKLAYLKSDLGIEARCLVWDIDGTPHFDRIYYTSDWICEMLKAKLLALGYLELSSEIGKHNILEVKIKNYSFDNYPYVDSFRYLSKRRGKLYAAFSTEPLKKGLYYVMNQTNGEIRRYEQDEQDD